jgi:hypothetical protein
MRTFIVVAAVLSGAGVVQAQDGVVRSGQQPSSSGIQSHWTPERMKQAKPVDVGRPPSANGEPSAPPQSPGNSGAAGGMPPPR